MPNPVPHTLRPIRALASGGGVEVIDQRWLPHQLRMATLSRVDDVFTANPQLRGYIVDDQGALRKHVFIFVDGARLPTAASLDVPIHAASEIHVLQALTGG